MRYNQRMAAPSAPLDPADDPTLRELIAARPHLSLHAMDGLLIDDVPLSRITDAVGTPTWVYAGGEIRDRYRALTGALACLAWFALLQRIGR